MLGEDPVSLQTDRMGPPKGGPHCLMARQVGHATERVLIKDIGWARRGAWDRASIVRLRLAKADHEPRVFRMV
jgi:hypothetical protein